MSDSEELHFKDGFWGKAAKLFQAAGNWGDPYEETVILPSLVSWGAWRLSQQNIIEGSTGAYVFFAATILSGVWLGVSWGFTRFIRVMLRGISVGLLTAALTILSVLDGVEKQYATRVVINLSLGSLLGFTMGFYLISPFRDIALTTEKHWQIGAERRRKIYAGFQGASTWSVETLRMAVGTKDVKGATLAQAVTAKLFGRLARWLIGAVLAIFIGGTLFGLNWNDLRSWWMQFRG